MVATMKRRNRRGLFAFGVAAAMMLGSVGVESARELGARAPRRRLKTTGDGPESPGKGDGPESKAAARRRRQMERKAAKDARS